VVQNKEEPQNKEYKRVKLYAETFSTGPGQVVLKDLRRQYCDTSSYTPGDPYETAFREGQRSVVLGILSELRQSNHPEKFEESQDEYEEE